MAFAVAWLPELLEVAVTVGQVAQNVGFGVAGFLAGKNVVESTILKNKSPQEIQDIEGNFFKRAVQHITGSPIGPGAFSSVTDYVTGSVGGLQTYHHTKSPEGNYVFDDEAGAGTEPIKADPEIRTSDVGGMGSADVAEVAKQVTKYIPKEGINLSGIEVQNLALRFPTDGTQTVSGVSNLFGTLPTSGGFTNSQISRMAGGLSQFGGGVKRFIDVYNREFGKGKEVVHVKATDTISDPMEVGEDLGRLMSLTEKYMRDDKLSQEKSYEKAMKYFPDLAYLVPTIVRFNKTARKAEVMNKLTYYMKVFTGKGMGPQSCFFNEQGFPCVRNEFGQVEVYTGAKGYVPAYDTWCGPQSPNNKLPTTLFGTYCMSHDIGYDVNGYFSLEDDLRFCARILNNTKRMGWTERFLASAAAHYFTTIGYTMSAFKADLPSNANEVAVSQDTNDISKEIFSGASYEARRRFYDGITVGLDNQTQTDNRPNRYTNNALLPLFDSIMVEVY